jgi:hypothetical protein
VSGVRCSGGIAMCSDEAGRGVRCRG